MDCEPLFFVTVLLDLSSVFETLSIDYNLRGWSSGFLTFPSVYLAGFMPTRIFLRDLKSASMVCLVHPAE